MSDKPTPISTTEGDEIIVRGHRLAGELLGRVTFTEMFLLDMDGALPGPHQVRVVDAVLVALMEHGITPSTLASRLVLDGAPEATQGAVAAGLLAVGSRFLGTIEQAAEMLQRIVSPVGIPSEDAVQLEVRRLLDHDCRFRARPQLARGSDPRVDVLIRIAQEEGVRGAHVDVLGRVRRCGTRELGER